MAYEFEWDPSKAADNRQKHGVSFEEATSVFADPLNLLKPDPAGPEFQRKYAEALQRSPDAVVDHGRTMLALRGKPV